MKASKIRELNNEELVAKLADLKKELFNLRLSHSSGQLSNNMALSLCKKDIARVQTVLKQRESTQQGG
ncbi:MAG: 50S ribosomal protein L29 [Clostridia bacterium]|nr:50S ribosomal protein L29 [Clostridia bacterium]